MARYIVASVLVSVLFAVDVFACHKDDGWCIEAVTREGYNGVTLANGRIGLTSGADMFSVSGIVLNGIYDKEFSGGVSSIVRAPVFTNLDMSFDGKPVDPADMEGWKQTLDMKRACLRTSALYDGISVEYSLMALRNLPYMALGIVEITPGRDVELEVENTVLFPEELCNTGSHFKVMRDLDARMPVFVSSAESRTGIHGIFSCSSFLFEDVGDVDVVGDRTSMRLSVSLRKGETYRFALVGAVCTSGDFNDPKGEAERMVVYALRSGMDFLLSGHVSAWDKLWESDIEIGGCVEDQRDVRLALYNLYSFQREGSRLSVPPMGLSSVGYNGHIFWDAEIWMYPPVLVLNQSLARSYIDYRTDRLGKALQRASLFGYEGAMYPWESDASGEESTPTWCLTGTFEHHVTADIGIAFWNYFCVVGDREWLLAEGYPVMKEVADFWVSRAVREADGSYSIKNVIGADEYAHNVDDNAFTNGAAMTALRNAAKAAEVLGIMPDPRWEEVASGLDFHYMEDGTTKEHSAYEGEMIKQADVNLLAYPLGIITDEEDVRRDLEYYIDKIDKDNGPAMGNAILSVLYSRLGCPDEAYRLFKMSYIPNKRPPFGVLSESPSSDNPYFATGAGGMLQAVLFGFAGLELTDDGIVQNDPALPEEWDYLVIKGVGPDRKCIRIENNHPSQTGMVLPEHGYDRKGKMP